VIKYGVMRPAYFKGYKTERKGMTHTGGNVVGGSVIKQTKRTLTLKG
jgi:hypothetical protein